jgi:hypothetical protein
MALDKAKLKAELLKILDEEDPGFLGFPDNAADAAANWAAAYDTYAADAEDVSGDAVASVNKAGFESALIFADSNVPAAAAGEFDLAFVNFWTGGTFAVGTPPSSGVGGNGTFGVELTSAVTVAAPGVLLAALTPIFAENEADQTPDAKAGKLADAFHDATTTAVTVLIAGLDTTPPASGGPLPITNTDFVY